MASKQAVEVSSVLKTAACNDIVDRRFVTSKQLRGMFDPNPVDELGRGDPKDDLAGPTYMFLAPACGSNETLGAQSEDFGGLRGATGFRKPLGRRLGHAAGRMSDPVGQHQQELLNPREVPLRRLQL